MPAAKPSESSAQVFRFRQSEALLRRVMEKAAVGMAIAGTNGQLVYVNDAYAEMFGYDADECVGLGVRNLVHPDDLARATSQVALLSAGEVDVYRAERRFLRKDGSSFWAMSCASSLRDDRNGRPVQLIIQLTDIDRQKRAEAALAASESRWNFALESAGQGVWDHDLRTKTAFFSRMWKQMRGIGPDEPVDPSQGAWLTRIHPDDRERIKEAARLQDSGEVGYNSFEYRERHRDGHWIWILSRGRPIEWMPDGAVARIIGTDTDITSLKEVEARLAEERERLRIMLESIGDGVISTDAAGRVRFMNPVAEMMTGWRLAEATGRPVGEVYAIVDEVRDVAPQCPVAACLQEKRRISLDEDTVLLGRSGGRRPVRSSASPVKNPTGEIVGAILVFQDVAESRAQHRELAHSAQHDSLTGLPNRSAFEAKLLEARESVRRGRREYALCFIDLDRFKAVNDGSGHAAGDEVLCEIGTVIKTSSRAQDFVGRIGGDEFALLLPDCSLADAKTVAQKLIDALTAMRFAWAGRNYQIGASIGVTAVTVNSSTLAAMMREADEACYAAKAAGGNCVSIYHSAASAVA